MLILAIRLAALALILLVACLVGTCDAVRSGIQSWLRWREHRVWHQLQPDAPVTYRRY